MNDEIQTIDKNFEAAFLNGFEAMKRKMLQHIDNEVNTLKKYIDTVNGDSIEIIVHTLLKMRTDVEEKFNSQGGW